MDSRIKCWLAASGGDVANAQALGVPCAWLLYRIGENGALQRAGGAPGISGGLMGIIDAPGLASADISELVRDIFMECGRRGFKGVLLDFIPPSGEESTLSQLSRLLRQKGVEHFASAELAAAAPDAKLIIPSALSGGSFDDMLQDAAARFGAQNLCIEIVRMRHDFTMPAYSPDGERITARRLAELIGRHGATAYFSPDLQCKYFTYREGGSVHFVLFDDESSCAGKIARARAAGFYGAFLLYSEWGDASKAIIGDA